MLSSEIDFPIILPNDLSNDAFSLHCFGVRGYAWPKNSAIQVIEHLASNSFAILGGDVYKEVSAQWHAVGDNWYTIWALDETWEEFVNRSAEESTRYITSYPNNPDVIPLFVLVYTNDEREARP